MDTVIVLLFLIFLCVIPGAVWRGLGSLIGYAIIIYLVMRIGEGGGGSHWDWLRLLVFKVFVWALWLGIIGVFVAYVVVSVVKDFRDGRVERKAPLPLKERLRASFGVFLPNAYPLADDEQRAERVPRKAAAKPVRERLFGFADGPLAAEQPDLPEQQPIGIPADDRARLLSALLDTHGRRR